MYRYHVCTDISKWDSSGTSGLDHSGLVFLDLQKCCKERLNALATFRILF